MNHPCWWWVIITFLTTVFICLFLKLCIKQNKVKKKMQDNDFRDTGKTTPDNHRLLFQSGNTYLQEMKNSQWHITYLCALLFGAIIAITQLKIFPNSILIKAHSDIRYLLQPISLLVILTNLYLITEHQYTIMLSRIAIDKHKKLIDFAHYWMDPGELTNVSKNNQKFFRNWKILLIFILPNIAGFAFVQYLLFWVYA